MTPVAVVRRMRFEGNAYEVVISPSMQIVAQGYETEEGAAEYAERFNKGQTK